MTRQHDDGSVSTAHHADDAKFQQDLAVSAASGFLHSTAAFPGASGPETDPGMSHYVGAPHDPGMSHDIGVPHDPGMSHDVGQPHDPGMSHDGGMPHDDPGVAAHPDVHGASAPDLHHF